MRTKILQAIKNALVEVMNREMASYHFVRELERSKSGAVLALKHEHYVENDRNVHFRTIAKITIEWCEI